MANSTYDKSVNYLRNFVGFGGNNPIPNTTSSLYRFVIASSMIQKYDDSKSIDIIDYSFNILSNISQGIGTKWSIVYDVVNKKIFYKTISNKKCQSININEFDYSCMQPTVMADINKDSPIINPTK